MGDGRVLTKLIWLQESVVEEQRASPRVQSLPSSDIRLLFTCGACNVQVRLRMQRSEDRHVLL
jgi:hypothetical protein